MSSNARIPSALLLATALGVAGTAGAASVDPDTIERSLEDAGVNGTVEVTVDEAGVARLSGLVDEPSDNMLAVRTARAVPGITRVVDLLRTDD